MQKRHFPFSVPILGRLLLAAVGCFLGLLAAEAVLRVLGYEGMHERVNTVFHDDLGQVPADAWVNDAVFDPRLHDAVEINGQSVPFAKPAGSSRIVFVGDSGTVGVGVAKHEAFPTAFHDFAESRGYRDLDVVNAGVVGMTTVGEYRLLADRLVTLRPDIVVLGLFMANDINFNLAQQDLLGELPPWWKRYWNRSREASALAHFTSLQLLALNAKFRLFGGPNPDQPTESIAPINLIEPSGIHMLDYLGGEIATYSKQYSPLMQDAFELLKRVLSRFEMLSRQHDFQLVVIVIPTASQIDNRLAMYVWPDPLGELRERRVDVSEAELDYQKPLGLVRDICTELEILCIDPTDDLRHLGAARTIVPNDDHLSAEGHRILAKSLIKHFDNRDRQFVSCSSCPRG